MTRDIGRHDDRHAELVALYALHALPADDVAAAGAGIAECPGCRDELARLGPIVSSFVSWPTDVLRPAQSLWDRLAERIAAETGQPALPPSPPQAGPDWREVAPGISVKILSADAARDMVSMLVRLTPGTDYPSHRHAAVEELHLLHGELFVDDRTLYPGDYLRSEPGTADGRVWSETGCTCVLMTSLRDAIF
jgi:hypothetical protein